MKKFLSLLISLLMSAGVFMHTATVTFAFNGSDFWDDSRLYAVLNDNSESNSSLQNAFLKVKYDLKSNRIYMRFLLTFSSFENDEKIAVKTAFNDIGEITFLSDGTNICSSDIFYAENDMFSDGRTGTVDLTVTAGIKEGIPKKLVISVIFCDPDGIFSNTYRIDISPPDYDVPAVITESKIAEEAKPSKEKTSKIRSTKEKTSKKQKSKKSAKPHSEKTSHEKETDGFVVGQTPQKDIIKAQQKKQTAVLLACASAILGTVIGCAVGIKQIHKKN